VVYEAPSVAPKVRLEWLDRTGTSVGSIGDPGSYSNPEISPDGSRSAFVLTSTDVASQGDLVVQDNLRGDRIKLTASPVTEAAPVWSPDGNSLAFASRQLTGGRGGWLRVKALAAAQDASLLDEFNLGVPSSWSRDNRFVLFTAVDSGSPITATAQTDIWILPLQGERKARKYRSTPFNEAGAVFSPDGRWVAYHSNESGRIGVYVAAFPEPADPKLISVAGGMWPQWRNDGRELFYLSLDGQLMAIDVAPESPPRFGAPRALFKATTQGTAKPYSPTPDGTRFLVATSVGAEAPAPLTLVVRKW
jgi:Tol biopolymer transport system component